MPICGDSIDVVVLAVDWGFADRTLPALNARISKYRVWRRRSAGEESAGEDLLVEVSTWVGGMENGRLAALIGSPHLRPHPLPVLEELTGLLSIPCGNPVRTLSESHLPHAAGVPACCIRCVAAVDSSSSCQASSRGRWTRHLFVGCACRSLSQTRQAPSSSRSPELPRITTHYYCLHLFHDSALHPSIHLQLLLLVIHSSPRCIGRGAGLCIRSLRFTPSSNSRVRTTSNKLRSLVLHICPRPSNPAPIFLRTLE